MKKQYLIAGLLAAASAFSAMGQGFVTFGSSKNMVYTAPAGTSGLGVGGAVAFLWAPTGTVSPLGAALSTTAVNTGAIDWSSINSMLSSGWTLAFNSGTSTEADGAVNASGVVVGGIAYNNGSPFQVAGTTAGTSYEFVAIGWSGGYANVSEASQANANLGWSSVFNYVTGSAASDPNSTVTFNGNGMTKFGVAPIVPVPEPATMALAALGGASLLLFRRRK